MIYIDDNIILNKFDKESYNRNGGFIVVNKDVLNEYLLRNIRKVW